MQFDRWVGLVQGGAIVPLARGADRLASMKSAFESCDRLYETRCVSEDAREVIERKLFLCLVLNCDATEGSAMRQMLPFRNVSTLFRLETDVVWALADLRPHFFRFVVEAVVFLPDDDCVDRLWKNLVKRGTVRSATILNLAFIYRCRATKVLPGTLLKSGKLPEHLTVAEGLFLFMQAARKSEMDSRKLVIPSDLDLAPFYGELCLMPTSDFPPCSAIFSQLIQRDGAARESLTVDKWMDFHEIATDDDLLKETLGSFWPSGSVCPGTYQQLIAHFAYECLEALNEIPLTGQSLQGYQQQLDTFAKEFVKEQQLGIEEMSLKALIKAASAVGQEDSWKRECYVEAICLWKSFGDVVERDGALECIATNPLASVKHIEVLYTRCVDEKYSGSMRLKDAFSDVFLYCPEEQMKLMLKSRIAQVGIGPELESSTFTESAIQFMNRVSLGSADAKMEVEEEKKTVQFEEQILWSLVMQSPKEIVELFVEAACANAAKAETVAQMFSLMPDVTFYKSDNHCCLTETVISKFYSKHGEEDDEGCDRLMSLASVLGKRTALVVDLINAFIKLLMTEMDVQYLVKVLQVLQALATPEVFFNKDKIMTLIAACCQLLVSLERADGKELALQLVLRFTSDNEQRRRLSLYCIGGTSYQFYFRPTEEAATLVQALHGIHGSSGGDSREEVNVKFDCEDDLTMALVLALPELLPGELTLLFHLHLPTHFDSPMTKLMAVLNALEIVIELSLAAVPPIIRAIVSYFDESSAHLRLSDRLRICQLTSGLLYLTTDEAVISIIGGLVTRLADDLLDEVTKMTEGVERRDLIREVAVLLVHAPQFESKGLIVKKAEAVAKQITEGA
jgi:hypothetical protein